VELHLVVHETGKLFSGAIARSAGRTPPEEQKPLFEFYASQAGVRIGACSISTSLSTQCEHQRFGSCIGRCMFYTIIRTGCFPTLSCLLPFSNRSYNAFIDDKIITDLPTRSILVGIFVRVPLMCALATCYLCTPHRTPLDRRPVGQSL